MSINARLEKSLACSQYGAQMGRPNFCDNPEAVVYIEKVEFVDGDYDLGGAYWGGSFPLWCAMDDNDEVQIFLRAGDLVTATKNLLADYPGLKVAQRGEIDVDMFLRHYMIAALWSTNDESDERGGEPMDANYSIDDIAPEAEASMRADCERFIKENAQALLSWQDGRYSVEEMGGHDFWLTRNHHGSGFWDGDWGDVGDELTEASHKFGECWLYVGDDGKIYLM